MDPLSQLRDIHLPDPVGLWPLAPGWWIAAVILLAIGVAVFRLIRNRIRQGVPRRNALRELASCYKTFESDRNENKYIININILLKKVAADCYGKSRVAKLSGGAWLAFLDKHTGENYFASGEGSVLATGPYRRDVNIDAAALQQTCKQWINAHD